MNGETVVTRLGYAEMLTPDGSAAIGRGDTVRSPDRGELVFSDPALDMFATAMALRPLPLACWVLAAVFKAAFGLVRR